MLFQLPTDTECELTTFVGRTQKSGPEDVPAVTFRLRMASVPNTLLDLISTTMRHTVYAPVEGQEQLPGADVTTPILRSKDLKHWAPETRLEGWRVIVARGITDGSALQMGTCKIDDFHFDFLDGGHMDVDFRISTADVDEAGAGMLWGRQKRKVFVTVTAPELPAKPANAIDASRDAPDLPPERDATDLFAAGEGEGPDDDTDTEGGETDVTGNSDDWPFPGSADGEAPPQSVTTETTRSPAGSRTARGREKTKAALKAGAQEGRADGGILEGTNRTTNGAIGQP